MINWIRVYKNPLRVDLSGEQSSRARANRLFLPEYGGAEPPVYDFSEYNLESVRFAYLLPSYYRQSGQKVYWVKFDGKTGDLFEDPAKEGDSGLVTATDHTSVKVGDIVAIAVNITSWGGACRAGLAIGPEETKPYLWSHPSVATPREEGRWRLNPNTPLWDSAYNGGLDRFVVKINPITTADATHTLVYQFRVEPAHVALNSEGAWIKQKFVVERRNLATRALDRIALTGETLPQWQVIDWIWGQDIGGSAI